jgi:hypothetical protein
LAEIEAAIGMSRRGDAREAGKEVARNTIKQLKFPPKLFLVFCTVDYEKNGGLQEFLNGIWEVLPKNTPLVGATIASFINNYGCFAYGATALAVSYLNMDVAVGYGIRTKRNPKRAANNCAKMIKKGLINSKFKNKFLFEMISSPIIPKIPFIGDTNNVKSKYIGAILARIGMPLVHYFGSGIGKEQDVLENLAEKLSDFYIIGGSSVDNGKMLSNYQFVDNQVLTNSVIGLGGSTDLSVFFNAENGVHKTNKKFEITKMIFHDYIISKIEKKAASDYFLKEVLEIPSELFYHLGPFYYRTADYFPFTFEENDERVMGVGCFLGNNILVSHKMPGKHAVMCSVNGDEIFETVKNCINNYPNGLPFLFLSSSAIYSFILRNQTHLIKDILDKQLKNIPYLMIQPMIEHVYEPNGKPNVRAYSTNALSLYNPFKYISISHPCQWQS